ncbi:hypothetical protein A8G00_15260 [Sphingobium sp. SA916]|nr:hypothetical protein A8G00_15260 [Sphingobium sp. SA916]
MGRPVGFIDSQILADRKAWLLGQNLASLPIQGKLAEGCLRCHVDIGRYALESFQRRSVELGSATRGNPELSADFSEAYATLSSGQNECAPGLHICHANLQKADNLSKMLENS